MRHVDDGHPALARLLDTTEEPMGARIVETRRRLIEQQHVRVAGKHSADLDDLALDRFEFLDQSVGQVAALPLGQALSTGTPHRAPVDQTQFRPRIVVQRDVLGSCQALNKSALLVDTSDSTTLGFGNVAKFDDAGVRGVQSRDDGHQGGLSGAISTEQSDRGSPAHRHRHITQRLGDPEALRDVVDANCCSYGHFVASVLSA